MTASGVLAIDTSTEACSAAVLKPDGTVCLRFALTERSHADLVLPMVDEVLRESGLSLRSLDGLAFGRGPGGFTGLRIAAGVIQGLAFAADLQVAPVSSLAAVAFVATHASFAVPPVNAGQLARVTEAAEVLVCNDARMQELYWCCYRFDAGDRDVPIPTLAERVGPPESVEPTAGVTDFAGNGFERHPRLRERLEARGLRFHERIHPRADAVARIGARMLARGEGVPAALALPTYVRDDVARPAKPFTQMS